MNDETEFQSQIASNAKKKSMASLKVFAILYDSSCGKTVELVSRCYLSFHVSFHQVASMKCKKGPVKRHRDLNFDEISMSGIFSRVRLELVFFFLEF